MAYEPKEPSTTRRVADTAAETVRGAGIGVLAAFAAPVAAVFFVIPAVVSAAIAGSIGGFAAVGLSILAVGAAAAVLFAGPFAGAVFGARKGIDGNEAAGPSPEMKEAKAIVAAQGQQLAMAEDQLVHPRRYNSGFMAAAPVFVAANGNCPNYQVSSIDYQGQKQAALQAGLAG